MVSKEFFKAIQERPASTMITALRNARLHHMVCMLFNGAQAAVSINGGATTLFEIAKGVWQGCPLTPYLFLFVGQALHAVITDVQDTGQLKDIIPRTAGSQEQPNLAKEDLVAKNSQIWQPRTAYCAICK